MAKTSKKSKRPSQPPKRKISVKDLKAKNAGSVKGGTAVRRIGSVTGEATDQDHKDWILIE